MNRSCRIQVSHLLSYVFLPWPSCDPACFIRTVFPCTFLPWFFSPFYFCHRYWRTVGGMCLNPMLAFPWWRSPLPIWTRLLNSIIHPKMEAVLKILRLMKLKLMTQISGKSFTGPLVCASTAAHGLEFLATAGSPLHWKKVSSSVRWIAFSN